jgi:hypothetical protein
MDSGVFNERSLLVTKLLCVEEGTWRSNTTSLLAEKAMVLTKQHVSAYLEACIRFTNVDNRRLVYIAKPCG